MKRNPAQTVPVLVVSPGEHMRERITALLKSATDPAFELTFATPTAFANAGFPLDQFDVCLLDTSDSQSPETRKLDSFLQHTYRVPLVMITEENNLANDWEAVASGAAGCVPHQELTPGLLQRSLCFAVARYQSEERWRRLATHDDLTELPRRGVFLEHLQTAIARAERLGEQLAVLFLDLNGFKAINDQHGHSVGDLLLQQTARRLRDTLRKGDIIARMGGDEFVILQQPLNNSSQPQWLAERLHRAIQPAFDIEDKRLQIGLSVGIARYPEDGSDAERLLDTADQDMYREKARHRSRDQGIPLPDTDEQVMSCLLQRPIKESLAAREFSLAFQPIIEVNSGRVIAMETFVRWNQPQNRGLNAAEFINLFEGRGLMEQLGGWVLEEGLFWQQRWSQAGFPDIAITFNLSAMELAPGYLAPTLAALLARQQTACEIWLEVSSSLLSPSQNQAFDALTAACELGAKVFLDNIGGGASCIETLTKIPVSGLKLDKAVTHQVHAQPIYRALAQSTQTLAHNVSLLSIASGVESSEQYEALRALGYQKMQGNYLCRPLSGHELLDWLDQSLSENKAASFLNHS